MRAWLLTLLLVILGCPDAVGAPQWRFRTFDTRDGLANNIVRDVLEDRRGNVWFATMAGVTRYDPAACSYRTEDLDGSLQEAMDLALGRDGALWVATQGGGVAAFRDGTWTLSTTRDGLPTDEITSLMIDRSGRVWATPTTGGIAMFDGQRWRTFTTRDGLSSGEIGRCAELRSGEIMCGTYEQPVLQRFDGKRWSQLVVTLPTPRHFYVHALLESAAGELWLATKGAGAIQGTPDKGGYRWTVHDQSSGLASNRIGAIRQVKSGDLWFATSSGVSRYDGQRWQNFSRQDGLGASHVLAITQTRDGAVWFATLGGGASRYAPSRWDRLTERQGLASANLTGGLLQARDGALWVGTDRGISVLRGGAWSILREGSMAVDHVNHMIQSRDGALWVATREGVRRRAGGQWLRTPPDPGGIAGPVHAVVKRIAQGSDGKIWLATSGGVSSTDGQKWTGYTRKDGLPSNKIHDIISDGAGGVWAATDNGVARLDGAKWTPFLSPAPASRTNRIYSLARSSGGLLWASGLEGVSSLTGKRWKRMDPNPWLPTGIYSRFVLATSDSSLWFAVRGLGVRRLHRGRWTAYSTADGLAADTVRDVAVQRDGTLLFATLGGGLSRYRPDTHAPQTHVGSPGPSPGVPSSVIQGEDLVVQFGGQDVLKETKTRDLLFSHRVDGRPWTMFASTTRAWLVGLEPGRHLFEVRAMDRDLNIDPTPARYDFRVIRPWWAQPWLIALVALSLLLVTYAVFRIARAMARERQAVIKEQAMVDQRRQFVRLASHELRKPLARLAHRAEVLTMPETLEAADRVGEYAGAIVEDSNHLSRLVETLLEQARIQEGLQLKLEPGELNQLAAKIVADFQVDLEPGEDRTTLEPSDRRLDVSCDPFYLPLAIRNLLDNAHKYGEGGPVEVLVRGDGGHGMLEVRDQGPGVPAEHQDRIFEPFFRGKTRPEHGGFGLGLSFARDIARAHGGDLILLEGTQSGSTFRLSLPIVDPPVDPVDPEEES